MENNKHKYWFTMKIDNNIKERPNCGTDKCSNKGFVLVGDRFVCGDCAVKFNNIKNKMIFEAQEELFNGN